ncbi:hypothetical protein D9757_003287 [Collybiopsis confluens]|uniref:non-specific serine/threonine protein kinase n=1 Tax=Collybiopsis confluens TaxID=2823264 RepID=A0A8H5HZG3_9AGAR|nr:hypothetical protein D9757_003287 [Collybiopsis confluens]
MFTPPVYFNLLSLLFSQISSSCRSTRYFHPSTAKFSMPPESTDEFDGPIFEFPVEPLGLPADASFGFFQGGPGDVLGPSNCYLLQAKLGYGIGSSVWLAKDNEQGRHVALKILSGYATQLNQEHKLRELDILQQLAAAPDDTGYCTKLLDHFYHRGIEEDGGHLCLALRLEQASLTAVWDRSMGLPVAIVKRLIRHILRGLSRLHAGGIVHTDLKPENIMIATSTELTPQALDDWVAEHPARVYPPMQSLTKVIIKAFISEKLPFPSIENLAQCDFAVGDLSHSQIVDNQTTDDIVPLTLRPPEVMLGGAWTPSVDIWTLGALASSSSSISCSLSTHFENVINIVDFHVHDWPTTLLTSIRDHHRRFIREGVSSIDTDEQAIEVIFWQIAAFTGQRYPPAVLALYPLSEKFFEPNGTLRSLTYNSHPLELCMRDAGFVGSESDVAGACTLIKRCLQLNPMARPAALSLLEDDSWLQS